MATRKAVKDAVIAYLSPTVADADAISFLFWVYYRWINQATLTGLDLQAEWVAWLTAGRPYVDVGAGNGLTWAAIKAL